MMTNLLCGLVEREVHCQTNRGQELKILEKVHSLCTNLSFTMEIKRKKVVIDCESSKRLVHIYGIVFKLQLIYPTVRTSEELLHSYPMSYTSAILQCYS